MSRPDQGILDFPTQPPETNLAPYEAVYEASESKIFDRNEGDFEERAQRQAQSCKRRLIQIKPTRTPRKIFRSQTIIDRKKLKKARNQHFVLVVGNNSGSLTFLKDYEHATEEIIKTSSNTAEGSSNGKKGKSPDRAGL